MRSGRIRLVRHLEDGTFVVLHVARPGETFAEASAFVDAYHCDALAEVASEVEILSKAAFLAALRADPEAGIGFARLLAAQVRDLRARAERRGIRSASERMPRGCACGPLATRLSQLSAGPGPRLPPNSA